MKQQYLIGIDLGSSFIKATIFDTQGTALGEAEQDNHPVQPRPGVAEYDGPGVLKGALEAVRRLLADSGVRPGDVAAVCMDGMISGTIGVGGDGEATGPYTNTLDMRFAPQLNDVMGRFHDLIRRKTGSGQPTIGPKMMWIRDELPDVYRRTARFVTITGYVAMKMAGLSAADAFIDYTHLWATGLSDTENYAWSAELCDAMELPAEKLPRIVKSTDVVGGLCPDAARRTGLKEGTPVVAGAADQSAGFVGAGVTRPDRMAHVAGTYPVITYCTDVFRPDMAGKLTEILASPVAGLYNPSSFIIGGGLTHHWFQETFAGAEAAEAARRGGGATAYEILDELAAAVPPGSERLIFNPHLGGRACPTRTNYRGAWIGFTWTHRREHFHRALLESIAYDLYLALRSMRSTYPEMRPEEVITYGGGARSSLWNQIKADVLGIPHVCLARADISALGSAIIAGCAVGIFDDMAATAERFVERERRFEPRPKVHEFYVRYAEFYGRLLERIDSAYDDLASLPEWPAGREG